ncbi:hypothetical protein [Streptomyces sp. NBC_00316]|uniref:hypothetical protein n=1 Tax=Streptomyces sp. NBC_00316 TaxID=2975710 RepID=UPI002E293E1C|nr:hypothetical protein [Streptomyces sp. NBC_00316]
MAESPSIRLLCMQLYQAAVTGQDFVDHFSEVRGVRPGLSRIRLGSFDVLHLPGARCSGVGRPVL